MTTVSNVGEAAGFEPQWRTPDDARGFWFRDMMHNPWPISPMNATLMQAAFEKGVANALGRLSMPIAGVAVGVHHGYVYLGPIPFVGTPDELEARFGEMQRITMELAPTILRDWRERFEPRVEEMAAGILAFDYAGSTTKAIAQRVASLFDLLVEAWDIHMQVNLPIMNMVFGFEEFLAGVAPEADVADARKLLQGFDNKSVETGKALWDLSRWARTQPLLADALREARVRDGQIALAGNPPAGAAFQERFKEFLDHYGWRSDVFFEPGHASWREDPSSALLQLKNFLAKPDEDDPFLAHRRQAAEREALTAEFEAKLPPDARPQFRGMLAVAQQFIPISEDHNFTIDQRFTMVVRHALLELGKRFADDGFISKADDVFYLEFPEIVAFADGTADTSQWPVLVRTRRQRRVDQGKMRPPLFLGTPLPADEPVPPLVTKFFGFGAQQSDDPTIISGNPCSAGSVTGIARIVLTLDEAHRLQPGEILVCPMTMPAWTPLFGVAAAIVADSGGPLSHCAVVAREYGIPCVAGTLIGTQAIGDGARILVDGTLGTVQLLDERPARG